MNAIPSTSRRGPGKWRHVALVFAALALGAACQWLKPAGQTGSSPKDGGMTLGDALAQTACPVQIAEGSAWVNRMPPLGGRQAMVHVSVRFAGQADGAVLMRSQRTTPEVLVLDVRAADKAPIPGQAAYRETSPASPFKRVELDCRGSTVFRIAEIEQVF